jgi:serine/threonine protein kinase
MILNEIDEDYTFGNKIGSGSFSQVYKALSYGTNKEFAIKVIEKEKIILLGK